MIANNTNVNPTNKTSTQLNFPRRGLIGRYSFVAADLARQDFIKNKKTPGRINCPECDNELIYQRSSSNGHYRGNCKTKDCLNWVE